MVDTVGQTTFVVTPVPEEPGASKLDGPAGWVVVVAAFLSMFAVFGVSYSFGAILIDLQADFGITKAAAAWFPAIATFLYFTIGIFTGRLADRHGPRPVLVCGAFALAAGMVGTAKESLIRARSDFKSNGWVSLEGKNVIIQDEAALKRFAGR